jgi:hypothetical protein
MTPEKSLMNDVRIALGKIGCIVIRMNVGTFLDPHDGRPVNTGIPVGFPDLMVLRPDGKACFIETKIHPRKPTEDQLRIQALLRSKGYPAGTAYSVDEALAIIAGCERR